MDIQNKILKCLCFSNPTLSSRFISFLGLMISMILITVLLSDKFGDDYDNSRLVALALGLDWQHLHFEANATHEADPEGKLISAIVITYAFLYAAIDLVLLYGTITNTRWCAFLWLSIELLGVISKIGALLFHLTTEPGEYKIIFYTGSVIYTVLTLWCCAIVYTAQTHWKFEKKVIFDYVFWSSQSGDLDEEAQNSILMVSPPPYAPNIGYDII